LVLLYEYITMYGDMNVKLWLQSGISLHLQSIS